MNRTSYIQSHSPLDKLFMVKIWVRGLDAISEVDVLDSKSSLRAQIRVCCMSRLTNPWASPDAKVIDTGCRDPFELAEIKCPELKFRVALAEACSGPNFYLEPVNGRVNPLIISFPQLPLNFVLNQKTFASHLLSDFLLNPIMPQQSYVCLLCLYFTKQKCIYSFYGSMELFFRA